MVAIYASNRTIWHLKWVQTNDLCQLFIHVRFVLAAIRMHFVFIGSIHVFELWIFVRSLRHFLVELWIVRLESRSITEVPLYMGFKWWVAIYTLSGRPLKLVDKFTCLGSNISSTESDVSIRLVKASIAIDRLSIIWKSDLFNKMKWDFFQAVDVSILL